MFGSFLFLLCTYFAFFAYLIFIGVSLERTGAILMKGVWQSLFAGLLFGIIPFFISPGVGVNAFVIAAICSSLYMLPVAAMSRERDLILPRSSAFEVVCLNVLLVTVGKLPHSFPFFDQMFGFVLRVVMNPFSFFIPPSLGWLSYALSFWPAVLALRLVSLGEAASRKFRFLLMLWVQVVGILWLIPASIGGLRGLGRDSVFSYVDAASAALGMVHVVFMWMSLRDAVFAQRTTLILERSEDSTEKIGVARALADRMIPGSISLPVLVAAGVLTWLAVRLIMSLVPDANPALIGFVGVVGTGAVVQKLAVPAQQAKPALGWPAAAAILLAALVGLNLSGLLPNYSSRITADVGQFHGSSMQRAGEGPETSCVLTGGASPGLSCGGQFWPMDSIGHPAGLTAPRNIDFARGSHYQIEALGKILHCHQIPLKEGAYEPSFDSGPQRADFDRFVLVYVTGAASREQFGWSLEKGGRCSSIRAVTFKTTPGGMPSAAYEWSEESRRARGEYASPLFTLRAL